MDLSEWEIPSFVIYLGVFAAFHVKRTVMWSFSQSPCRGKLSSAVFLFQRLLLAVFPLGISSFQPYFMTSHPLLFLRSLPQRVYIKLFFLYLLASLHHLSTQAKTSSCQWLLLFYKFPFWLIWKWYQFWIKWWMLNSFIVSCDLTSIIYGLSISNLWCSLLSCCGCTDDEIILFTYQLRMSLISMIFIIDSDSSIPFYVRIHVKQNCVIKL